MSKNRSKVVLVVLLLLAMPALASDQLVAPSPTAFMADLWSELVEVVQSVFESSETGDDSGPILDPPGDGVESSSDDENGPMVDPNG